ncbi:MAG: hypothetical protein R3247_07965, partial [Rhodothermales bacterium]|nr:hypothetical protein [Rhodothermales bacterium]
QPEVVARHYTEAGNAARAVAYWQRAGEQALERSATREAAAHLAAALALTSRLPEAERARTELFLLLRRGMALQALRGFAASEVETTYARARTLIKNVQIDPVERFFVFYGLAGFYNTRAQYTLAREFSQELLRIAEETGHPALRLEAHWIAGMVAYHDADMDTAERHLAEARRPALWDAYQPGTLPNWFDPRVATLYFTALVEWHRGLPDQALKRVDQARTIGETVRHPFTEAWIHSLHTDLLMLRREWAALEEAADPFVALCEEQAFPFFLYWALGKRYLARCHCGGGPEDRAAVVETLAVVSQIGTLSDLPRGLARVAITFAEAGAVDEAEVPLRRALEITQTTDHKLTESLLLQARGCLLLARGAAGEAEDAFRQALRAGERAETLARTLQAGLRLAHLLHDQHRTDEARAVLAPLYARFTEGFETPDLREARALLDAMAEA